jgi:pyridoxal phosphate enzyme (YggS family)
VTELEQRLNAVRERLAAAAQCVRRNPDAAAIVAATKAVAPERVEEARAAGLTMFGESKVQEAKAKIPLVSSRARWHMIGHLQTNKARDAVELFELIHSVDSVKLAGELDKYAGRAGKTQPILLEINVSGEASKSGLKLEELAATLEQINALPRIEIRGLMTIAPFAEDAEKARPHFRRLRELRDEMENRLGMRLPELSMGMSHDFEVAVEEGATMVRIGTAIFGERRTHDAEQ